MWWMVTRARREVVIAQASLIGELKRVNEMLEDRHKLDCERIDRLMEALARRAGVDLIMPAPPLPEPERINLPNPWKDPNVVTDKFPKEKTQ